MELDGVLRRLKGEIEAGFRGETRVFDPEGKSVAEELAYNLGEMAGEYAEILGEPQGSPEDSALEGTGTRPYPGQRDETRVYPRNQEGDTRVYGTGEHVPGSTGTRVYTGRGDTKVFVPEKERERIKGLPTLIQKPETEQAELGSFLQGNGEPSAS